MKNIIQACISRSALRNNALLIKSLSQPAHLCAMVKANAYGHSALLTAQVLTGLADVWGVATFNEAFNLRENGLREPVIVFCPLNNYMPPRELREILDFIIDRKIEPVISSMEGLKLLARRTRQRGRPAKFHLKVDTGMGRGGCLPDELLPILHKAAREPLLKVAGVCSHFAASDIAKPDFARRQTREFQRLIDTVSVAGLPVPPLHMANSAAIFNLPDTHGDMVRPGISLYGYGGSYLRNSGKLRPVLDVYAPVVMVKQLPKGHVCGYGCTFKTKRRTRVGLVYAGYADGYSRGLSNAGIVDFDGIQAPVLGRVSMDSIIVDITKIPAVNIGSRARLISRNREDPHSVESLARTLKTIPHEITCMLGTRVARQLVA